MKQKSSPTPFTRSYWVVLDRLVAGCYPGDPKPAQAQEKLGGLVRCGVGLVINLMHPDERDYGGKLFVDYRPTLEEIAREAGRRVRCEWLSIYDNDVPTVAQMRTILDTIDRPMRQGKRSLSIAGAARDAPAPSSAATSPGTNWPWATRHCGG